MGIGADCGSTWEFVLIVSLQGELVLTVSLLGELVLTVSLLGELVLTVSLWGKWCWWYVYRGNLC